MKKDMQHFLLCADPMFWIKTHRLSALDKYKGLNVSHKFNI